jgi:hypothetical protein
MNYWCSSNHLDLFLECVDCLYMIPRLSQPVDYIINSGLIHEQLIAKCMKGSGFHLSLSSVRWREITKA